MLFVRSRMCLTVALIDFAEVTQAPGYITKLSSYTIERAAAI